MSSQTPVLLNYLLWVRSRCSDWAAVNEPNQALLASTQYAGGRFVSYKRLLSSVSELLLLLLGINEFVSHQEAWIKPLYHDIGVSSLRFCQCDCSIRGQFPALR